MTLAPRTIMIISVALGALMTLPAGAQSRRRAVSPVAETGPTTQITGTVKDATNGVPVEQAVVSSGGKTTATNLSGQFALMVPIGKASIISIEHPSFSSFSQSITAQVGGQYDFVLVEKASVTILLKTGETHIVDIGTAQFAYADSFIGYYRNDNANFCKQDGSDFKPNKTEFSRIVGPAAPATATACCQKSVMAANVEMKSGDKLLVYFKDSCPGNDVVFLGREKSTARYEYFLFTNITSVDFP